MSRSWYKISCIPYNIYYGIQNLIAYFPVIWKDRDWDGNYLLELLEKKLSRMEHSIGNGPFVNSKKDGINIKKTRLAVKRLIDDNYYLNPNFLYTWERQEKQDLEYVTTMLRKHLRTWWN